MSYAPGLRARLCYAASQLLQWLLLALIIGFAMFYLLDPEAMRQHMTTYLKVLGCGALFFAPSIYRWLRWGDEPRPRYRHDCASCRFLGCHTTALGRPHDLYACENSDLGLAVFARHGDAPGDYRTLSAKLAERVLGDQQFRDFPPLVAYKRWKRL